MQFPLAHNFLMVPEVEKAFVSVAIDVGQIFVLDSVDIVPDLPGFRIQCHDFYGTLPEIIITDTGDRYPVLERISIEAAKLVAVVRLRQEIASALPGTEFLMPTHTDGGVVVGLQVGCRTFLAEAANYLAAYHILKQMLM
jgi:hypothetical protein